MTALIHIGQTSPAVPSVTVTETGFDFSDLRTFSRIPRHNHDVVAMLGLVVVYDHLALRLEEIEEGKLYVRESQHPQGGGTIDGWYRRELQETDIALRAQPVIPLVTRREVVQAIEHPRGGPAFRLASGFIDGPYKDYCYGWNLVGKVVGVYQPGGRA